MALLLESITDLISLRKEGDYWDFKLKHHDNPVDLVKDIICLANTVRHKGKRYLIFGICPDTYEVIGVEATQGRRTQADIISTLRNARFSSGQFPDITLETIKSQDKEIDVLIISDEPQKPYYLESDYTVRGNTVRAGAVYARTQDTNTPVDKVAPAIDVERMWRERFGLDNKPFDRLKVYLLDFDGWENIEENEWYYKEFPEFTIAPTADDTWEVEGGENWVRAAINPRAYVRPMVAKFHQTVLAKVICIYFDEMRCMIPKPTITGMEYRENRWFYSFCADNFDFLFLQFLLRKEKDDLIKNGILSGRIGNMPILIFASENEKDDFETHLESHPIAVESRHVFTGHNSDPRVTDHDRAIISYSKAAIEYFHNAREKDIS